MCGYYCPWIANVERIKYIFVEENCDYCRSAKLRIYVTVEELIIRSGQGLFEDLADLWRLSCVFFKQGLQILSLFELYLLIKLFFMKADTKCPLSPCPSHTQNNLTPKAKVYTIAMSWFIFCCFPFVPAFVFTTDSILKVFRMGVSFFFLLISTVWDIEFVEGSKYCVKCYSIFFHLFFLQFLSWATWIFPV